MLKRGLKSFARQALMSSAGRRALSLYRGFGSVLMYHRVCSDYPDAFEPHKPLRVTPDAFEEQLIHCQQSYKVCSLEALVSGLARGRTTNSHHVAITFDDGYADNIRCALPILEKYQLPATIFLCNDFVSGKSNPWWDELAWIIARTETMPDVSDEGIFHSCETFAKKEHLFLKLNNLLKQLSPIELKAYLKRVTGSLDVHYPFVQADGMVSNDFMSWSDVQALSAHPLLSFQAHTKSHFALKYCDEQTVVREIEESRQEIENYSGQPVPYIAYPFGSEQEVGPDQYRIVERLSVKAAFTTRFGHIQRDHKAHLSSLPRIAVDGTDDLASFQRKLTGYDAFVFHRGQRLVL